MHRLMLVLVLGLLVQTHALFASDRPSELLGRASVIDGDTIEVQGSRLRLSGIDAPESGQRALGPDGEIRIGQAAAFALADKVGAQPVRCAIDGTDRYRRLLATCFLDGVDLNGWMVREGWALAFRRYSQRYVGDEDVAREAGRGIWATRFVPPWDWRRGEREPSLGALVGVSP
jgi:endonuclease YncB( thermonuclease family)